MESFPTETVTLTHPPQFKRVKKACVPCRNAKIGCDQQRPCARCMKHGIQSSCIDVSRKARTGGKKSRPVEDNQKMQYDNLEALLLDIQSSPSSPPSYINMVEKNNNTTISPMQDGAIPLSPPFFLNPVSPYPQDQSLPLDLEPLYRTNISPRYSEMNMEITTPRCSPFDHKSSNPPHYPSLAEEVKRISETLNYVVANLNQQQQSSPSHPSSIYIPPLPSYLCKTDPRNRDEVPTSTWNSSRPYPIVDCNPAFAKLLGYVSAKDLILGGLLRWEDVIHPRIKEAALLTCRESSEKGIPFFERPAVLVKKDGGEVNVYMNITKGEHYFVIRLTHVLQNNGYVSVISTPQQSNSDHYA